jgi:hypothetical protein
VLFQFIERARVECDDACTLFSIICICLRNYSRGRPEVIVQAAAGPLLKRYWKDHCLTNSRGGETSSTCGTCGVLNISRQIFVGASMLALATWGIRLFLSLNIKATGFLLSYGLWATCNLATTCVHGLRSFVSEVMQRQDFGTLVACINDRGGS